VEGKGEKLKCKCDLEVARCQVETEKWEVG
jgi:hypothetical protein